MAFRKLGALLVAGALFASLAACGDDDSAETSNTTEGAASGGNFTPVTDDTLTVVTVDRPGVFAKVAGVLALHGLGVLDANAFSADPGTPQEGMALARFRVESSFGPVVPWDRVVDDLAGRLEEHEIGNVGAGTLDAARCHRLAVQKWPDQDRGIGEIPDDLVELTKGIHGAAK